MHPRSTLDVSGGYRDHSRLFCPYKLTNTRACFATTFLSTYTYPTDRHTPTTRSPLRVPYPLLLFNSLCIIHDYFNASRIRIRTTDRPTSRSPPLAPHVQSTVQLLRHLLDNRTCNRTTRATLNPSFLRPLINYSLNLNQRVIPFSLLDSVIFARIQNTRQTPHRTPPCSLS